MGWGISWALNFVSLGEGWCKQIDTALSTLSLWLALHFVVHGVLEPLSWTPELSQRYFCLWIVVKSVFLWGNKGRNPLFCHLTDISPPLHVLLYHSALRTKANFTHSPGGLRGLVSLTAPLSSAFSFLWLIPLQPHTFHYVPLLAKLLNPGILLILVPFDSKNCTKKIFMTQIITMVWSLT